MIEVRDLHGVPSEQVGAWARHVSENLREQDRDEVQASSGMDPRSAVALSVLLSRKAYAILDRDKVPVAMFGVAPHPLPNVGVVWLLGTDGMLREAHSIARQSPPYIDELQRDHLVIWNYVDERNSVSLRWLRWMGFKAHGEKVTEEGHRFLTLARSASV